MTRTQYIFVWGCLWVWELLCLCDCVCLHSICMPHLVAIELMDIQHCAYVKMGNGANKFT